jgi:hypothetical protein
MTFMLNDFMLVHCKQLSPIANHAAACAYYFGYTQIRLGAGAVISCLASLLQLRGSDPAQPHHVCGDGGDVLLFNGELACSTS